MGKIYIFTDGSVAEKYENEIQEQYLEDYFGDYIFIVCEDGDTLITNEEGNAVFVQEYFE
jgi:hypothetical protein